MEQKRVLVVEDNEDLLELVGRYLKGAGWEVALAHGGRECWERLKQNPPSVILLDMVFSDGNGFEIARSLKKERAYRDIRILAMTGLYSRKDLQRCFEAGCSDVLLKPFRLTVLDRTLTDLANLPQQAVMQDVADKADLNHAQRSNYEIYSENNHPAVNAHVFLSAKRF